MNSQKKYISEFVGLDLLRFILAVVVVMVHYYHFYTPFPDGPANEHSTAIPEQPLYFLFWPIYDYGRSAVQVFWLISGLIFYSVYYQDIANRKVSFEKFSFLRFTRLYPLHFVTLIAALIFQLAFYSYHHSYFAYQTIDLSHFFLQLFFIGGWSPSVGFSFNVPMWSVSIEIFVYIIFYMLAVISLLDGKKLFLMIGASLVFIHYGILKPFDGCLLYFLSGCLLARLFGDGVSLKSLFVRYVIAGIALGILIKVLRVTFSPEQLAPFADVVKELKNVPIASSVVISFIFAFKSVSSPRIISLFKELGNMTYSVYAVHFLIQIVMFLIINPMTYKTFDSPVYLFIFMGVSIGAGWVAFEYFERPIQKYLRTIYEGHRKPRQAARSMEPVVDEAPVEAHEYNANSAAAS
jgi:peptidoglycan/LPS O-acetylase OafA/YrhL